jgi:ABC-type hemin transport system ATPase subunit
MSSAHMVMLHDLEIAAQYAVEPVNVKTGSGYRANSKVRLLIMFYWGL